MSTLGLPRRLAGYFGVVRRHSTSPPPELDPLERMASTLDDLEAHVRGARVSSKRLERNRTNLLYVHAISGILVGPLFYGYAVETGLDNPSWRLLGDVYGAGVVLAVAIGVGGLILLTGTLLRSLALVMIGLVGIASWYGTTAITFLFAAASWAAGGRQGAVPGTYAAIVYAHMTAIMLVHLRTVWKLAHPELGSRTDVRL